VGFRILRWFAVAALFALVALPAAATGHGRSGDTVEAIADGGFENSTCHDAETPYGPTSYCEDPAWSTGDLQASICGQPGCAGLAAHGAGFLSLGGGYMESSNPMVGSVSQTVDLPPGRKTLTFAIRVSYENPVTAAVASVEVDGTPVFAMASGEASQYATESVDLTGYSGAHEISFKAECSYELAMPTMRTCDGFRVDDVSLPVTLPDLATTLDRTPPAKTRRHHGRFTFSSNVGTATFRCRLDGRALGACSSPLRVRVGPGRHRLTVRALDGDRVEDPPARYRWRVTKRR
jgi:hypothetical protein